MAVPTPWRQAWQSALYGTEGFFRRQNPANHFRTSANSGPQFAEAIWQLIQAHNFDTVVDVGAGRGELLEHLHSRSDGALQLSGIEIADRPEGLAGAIGWSDELPDHIDGLLIANEWLDNIPCDVVEADENGDVRSVLIDPRTGIETLGDECADPWLGSWWPLDHPGQRAEIGRPRDEAWADAVARVDGIAIAIDYGHTRDDRPCTGSLRSYRDGHETDVRPDGTRDVTAHVAVDSVAAAVSASVSRQTERLAALGVSGTRPPLELAHTDPAGYLRALSAAGMATELKARGGWGDNWWIWTDTRTGVQG